MLWVRVWHPVGGEVCMIRGMAADSSSVSGGGVTRLAPSPTGALHLGNVRTFVINWVMARRRGWRVVMRIEDLDGPRVKEGVVEGTLDVLRWLGLDWDEGPYEQLGDLSAYEDALRGLAGRGRLYECVCTRREIEAAQSAPHGDEHELRYPGTCRVGLAEREGLDVGAAMAGGGALRFVVEEGEVVFEDGVMGEQRVDVAGQVGDFVVATKAGLPAYQLAVVVDDARQGVTDVVRGDDLVRSAGRQLQLYRALGLEGVEPRYWHVPLVVGEDGRRLAKRHGDTRVAMYREMGVGAERVLGLMARWCGLGGVRREMGMDEFVGWFELGRVPGGPMVFSGEDDEWLRAGVGATME